MKKRLIATVASLALTSCGATSARSLSSNPRLFSCSPSAVTPNDTLVLSKTHPELRELAVRRPGSSTPHFLVVRRPPAQMVPLMSPEQLGASREVRVPVNELTGLEWRVGAEQEPIFTVPGTYQFVLGTVLESEESAYMCEVVYQPLGKRADNSFEPSHFAARLN